MSRLLTFWGLSVDPFRPVAGPCISTAGQDEALARILFALEQGDRRVVLKAEAGTGKSVVLSRVAEALRWPTRRVVTIGANEEIAQVLAKSSSARRGETSPHWSALLNSARELTLQGKSLVLLVDDAHRLGSFQREAIDRLSSAVRPTKTAFQCVEFGRDETDWPEDLWGLAVRLQRLTRGETAEYLGRKLALAGRTEPIFSPRAITRLHAVGLGLPRAVDRLASLAMMAGAARGVEIVTAEIVDGVSEEVVLPAVA